MCGGGRGTTGEEIAGGVWGGHTRKESQGKKTYMGKKGAEARRCVGTSWPGARRSSTGKKSDQGSREDRKISESVRKNDRAKGARPVVARSGELAAGAWGTGEKYLRENRGRDFPRSNQRAAKERGWGRPLGTDKTECSESHLPSAQGSPSAERRRTGRPCPAKTSGPLSSELSGAGRANRVRTTSSTSYAPRARA